MCGVVNQRAGIVVGEVGGAQARLCALDPLFGGQRADLEGPGELQNRTALCEIEQHAGYREIGQPDSEIGDVMEPHQPRCPARSRPAWDEPGGIAQLIHPFQHR